MVRTAWASPPSSGSGPWSPVLPGTFTSRTALGNAVVITGRPAAIASSVTRPNVSRRLGMATMSASVSQRSTSSR